MFHRTWGREARDFWPEAITRVRNAVSGFTFLAEVYWDLEWTLQQKGFDYCYDKRPYDRLRTVRRPRSGIICGRGSTIRSILRAFENHDEPRAASVFSHERHGAAAVLTYFTPGLRFFHQGQSTVHGFEFRPIWCGVRRSLSMKPSSPLFPPSASPEEAGVPGGFVAALETATAWEGNPTASDFIAFAWTGPEGERALVAVNFSDHPPSVMSDFPGRTLPGSNTDFRTCSARPSMIATDTISSREGSTSTCRSGMPMSLKFRTRGR